MITSSDLNQGICFICRKKIDINLREDNKEKFVYVHFTNMNWGEGRQYLYFCPECWETTAGEEFGLEGFSND